MKKTYFAYETDGAGCQSTKVFAFTASSLTQAKLIASRRSTLRYNYLVLGDQINAEMELTSILAVRHHRYGWREYVGKDNPYAF